MESFEAELARATDSDNPDILAAIGLVINSKGDTLYHHASGRQSLAPDAPPVDPCSTITLGSAGKFITHIAALQCVYRGLITLDEPVYTHLPELEKFDIISPNTDPHALTQSFTLRRPSKQITLRHLLTHSSGISYHDHPLVKEWSKSDVAAAIKPGDEAPLIVKMASMPLLYEPGDGWSYGSSILWTTILITRLTQQSMPQFVQESIFNPLGMTLSSYQPQSRPDVCARLLKMVRREGERLVPVDDIVQDLTCSVSDIGTILSDLISPSSKILADRSVELLFQPQFDSSSPALKDLRGDTEDYASPAGIPDTMENPPVNYSLVGLLAEGRLPLSYIPPGTVTWNGMPNVMWAMNKEKGVAMLFATQLLPVDDKRAVDVAMTFMRDAWAKFAQNVCFVTI
ncbi:beta-lactamase family protein [Mycena pura]|uniref:Beta-lactamase family protein n=1 Tax=Mycena pura TaxID=153505 RepID=A0AAD6YFX9_9AGAR|nr:beta-lactamase family protein [Mycena pura]